MLISNVGARLPNLAPRASVTSLSSRAAAVAALLLTWPVLPVAALVSLLRGRPLWETGTAVLPAEFPGRRRGRTAYRSLAAWENVWSRWPRIWNVALGEFAWTGNPPLTPAEAEGLTGEFENLWLSIPPGVFTAPEAEGAAPPWDDGAKAHAALFACGSDAAWRRRVVLRGLFPRHAKAPTPAVPPPSSAPDSSSTPSFPA